LLSGPLLALVTAGTGGQIQDLSGHRPVDLSAGRLWDNSRRMDPSRKRAIRLTIALTVALLLASALVYTSFAAGRQELTASQLVKRARPGSTYILAGTVLAGSVRHQGSVLLFRVRDPKLHMSVPVRYTGTVPDPFAPGRAVLVTVREGGSAFVGQPNSLTTKCPSKYQAASASY
jgi:cytochrome c-type biogenesis protein CcmE